MPSVLKTSLALRARAVFKTSGTVFLIRTSQPVNNIYISFLKCFQVFCNPIIHNLNTSNFYSTSYALVPQPCNAFAQILVRIAYLFFNYLFAFIVEVRDSTIFGRIMNDSLLPETRRKHALGVC